MWSIFEDGRAIDTLSRGTGSDGNKKNNDENENDNEDDADIRGGWVRWNGNV